MFIEATRMPGKETLTLTGQLGDVMRESAQIANSYVRSKAAMLNIDTNAFEKTGVHLHVPAGATPKDGPSAGIAMVTAIASLFCNKIVRGDVGMTGGDPARKSYARRGYKDEGTVPTVQGFEQLFFPGKMRKTWKICPLRSAAK